MDAKLRSEARKLRGMGSEQAASHLIQHWPRSDKHTFIVIEHLSWKVTDQIRLAAHFLPGKTFPHAYPYGAFASFMSAKHFLAAIDQLWPDDAWDRDLLLYHLGPILNKYAVLEGNRAAIAEFLASHQQSP
ncbi:MAG: hypothetical protein ABUS57_10375 [Pseudomonadota bacterium]